MPMWKPDNVVAEHRTRATRVWKSLLLVIVGYTLWQIVTVCNRFNNPTTSFSVSDKLYPFPKLVICISDGQGCDQSMAPGACIDSVLSVVYDSCGEQDESITAEKQTSHCVSIDLTQLDFEKFGSSCSSSGSTSDNYAKKPSTSVMMGWPSSLSASREGSYSVSVRTYLGDELNDGYSTVPYNRVVCSPDSADNGIVFTSTSMTIGKSVRKYLSAEDATIYPTLTISTADLVIPEGLGLDCSEGSSYSDFALGYLYLTLTQGSNSFTELSDNNPLDIGTFLGNMGGFWELLIVTWGLCFVASRRHEPNERARDFANTIRRGKEAFDRKRRSLAPTVASDQDCSDEEGPSFHTSEGGVREEVRGGPSGGVRGISLVNDSAAEGTTKQQVTNLRQGIVVNAKSFRRPIPQEHPIRRDPVTYSVQSAAMTGRNVVRTGGQSAREYDEPPPPYSESL